MIARGLRQWWKTAVLAATGGIGESPLFLFEYALRGLRVVVLLAIWRSVVEAAPGASPMPLAALLTYTLMAGVLGPWLDVRTQLSEAFWQGSLVHHFLRPMGVVRQFAADLSGRQAVDALLFSLPLLLLAPWLGVDPTPAGAIVPFGLSLVLAVVVGLALEFGFGAVTLWIDQPVWLVEFVRRALSGLLSGAIVPLALMPFGLDQVLPWLPFAATAWAPLAIYTGVGDPVTLLASQVAWGLVLWPLVLLAWSRGRERLVAYGG